MRHRMLVSLLLPLGLPACMAVDPPSPLSSTQGTTLVETGEVIAIAPLSAQPRIEASQTRLTVRLATGEVRSYTVDAAAGFRIGDRVGVSSNRGKVGISRQ